MTEFIEVAGKRLEIERHEGNAGRPVLVFLHEGLGCIDMWRGFPARVAEATGCPTLVYSRQGYGRSDPADLPHPVTYMHREALEILPELLKKVNIGPHILIGHSDGGSIALIHGGGIQSPDTRAIVTLAAHVFNEEVCVRSIEEVRDVYRTTNLGEKLRKYHNDPDHTFWGWNDIWLHPDFWHWNIEEYLPGIDVPTLVIQGFDDQYGTLAQVEAIVEGIGPHAKQLLIPDCKHSPHLEQPDVTLQVVAEFVNKFSSG